MRDLWPHNSCLRSHFVLVALFWMHDWLTNDIFKDFWLGKILYTSFHIKFTPTRDDHNHNYLIILLIHRLITLKLNAYIVLTSFIHIQITYSSFIQIKLIWKEVQNYQSFQIECILLWSCFLSDLLSYQFVYFSHFRY